MIVGVLSIIVGSSIGSYFSVIYDGIVDAHSAPTTFINSFKQNIINVLTVFAVLIILGKLINSKTRIIDILNISMIYRIPIYLSSTLISIPLLKNIGDKVLANSAHPENIEFEVLELVALLAISSVLILFIVYAIVLLTNGFKNATNLKNRFHYILFALALIVAEIVSKIIINNL